MLQLASEERRHSAPTISPERSGCVEAVETTEIRWFANGALPRDVHRWFTGPAAAVEQRRDRYLLDERTDVGVKFRNGETLELKTRLQTGRAVELADGPAGVLERWTKWTPADGLVRHSTSLRWIDVDKWIVKRRFSLDGADVGVSPSPNGDPFCDVEIVAVRAGGATAWSVAFEANGPQCSRLLAIRAAWLALAPHHAPTIRRLVSDRGKSMGYPEWLGRFCR